MGCKTTVYSNWSLTEEIERLAITDKVENLRDEYAFHKADCHISLLRQCFISVNFIKGVRVVVIRKSGNVTHVRKSRTYYLIIVKRTVITSSEMMFYIPLRVLINRTAVKRICEVLGIGSSTYYAKLEQLYKRCLEFNAKFESPALSKRAFEKMWVNTDKFHYHLNNVRKKGHSDKQFRHVDDKLMQTYVIVSTDSSSRYVFRTDIAYDWTVTLNDIENDTVTFKEDHLKPFACKNDRLRIPFAPQPPTQLDTQNQAEYEEDQAKFIRRKDYIDGMHVGATYTTMAHFWHIKNLINAKEWRFISDDDQSIITSLLRVYSKEIRLGEAHHFLCHINKTNTKKDAHKEHQNGKDDLRSWGFNQGHDDLSLYKIAHLKLQQSLKNHKFYEQVQVEGKTYRKSANTPIEHPIPTIDQGFYNVDCTTDVSAYEIDHLASMLLKVNDRSTNAFMQQIRRRISIFERPLVTARGDGKSYIYANFNPKYAQYALTILRTFYNFCLPYRNGGKERLTPAQRLGITDKQFSIKDILYTM